MTNFHFLVVDDDAESLAAVVEYLRAMGYEKITQCRDGADAMRTLDRDPSINFIISDWDMPMMNGHTLLQRVRSHPSKASIPFMIMTSPISRETEKVILAAESLVDAYLIKPFRSEALKTKIETIVQTPVRGPQKQVLVVDDDKDAREMVIDYLKKLGFKDIYAVDTGRAALSYLENNAAKMGMIVSDWEMPEVNGLELLQACKKNPGLADIPFLMITSQSSIERIKVMQAAQAHVDQYLLKPFNAAEIRKRVEQLLEKARSRNEVRNLTAEGLKHLDHQRHKPAQEAFEAALNLDPEFDLALRGLGDVLSRVKGVEAALAYYKKAADVNPFNPTNYSRLATAYEQIGMIDKGIALLQEALKQVSFNAQMHFQLGRFYNKKGYLPLAQAEFEKTLEIQPDHAEARMMLALIKNPQKEG